MTQEKINIAELLKDCPKGMELDCTIYNGKVCFEGIDDSNPAKPIIKISVNLVHIERLDAWGQYCTRDYAKCVIFPKGKTTWDGFVPPCRFKAGDVLVSENGNIVLLSHIDSKNVVHYHCIIPTYGSFRIEENTSIGVGRYYECVLANEQQRQRMYDKIKCSGYKYNQQLNKLEKMVEPKFKVGDRVYNIVHNENQTITALAWDFKENEVVYQTNNNEYVYVNYLQPCKEETMENKLGQITLDIPDGYEFFGINDDNKLVLTKIQPKYPKTYEECCEVLFPNTIELGKVSAYGYKGGFLTNFGELLICRDAYRKIAGDWKPDWKTADERKYCIVNTEGNIKKWAQKTTNKVLAFPTEEMQDAFYENFKELIEECKEFL